MKNQNEKQLLNLQLTKDSNVEQIKAYFTQVFNLKNSGEEFPATLDAVWPLVYSEKGKALRALKDNQDFVEGIDYQVFAINGKNLKGGRPTEVCEISLPCLEFFIARKVRPVFEVYRQLAHAYVECSFAFADKKYITKSEYCQRFNKSEQSFNGLLGHYKMEFLFLYSQWYISTNLCNKVELELKLKTQKAKLKEENSRQYSLQFSQEGGSHV